MQIQFKDTNNGENNGEVVFDRTLLPSQEKFWKSEKPFILLSGGYGSGKTEPLILRSIFECMSQPDNYFLLGRKTYQEVYDVLWKDFNDLCHPSWIKSIRKSPHPTVELNTFYPGKTSTIIFRNLDKMAENEIKGLNLGGFAIDQVEDIPEAVFQGLTFRLRRKGINHKVFLTQNPELNWLHPKLKPVDETEFKRIRETWEVIEAPSTENYKNLPKETVELYESYKITDPGYYKQYVLAVWDESLMSENTCFAREHIERLIKMTRDPIREVEGLKIYKDYIPGHKYQMGVDCAEGLLDGDFAAITIADLTTYETVATWAQKVSPDVTAEQAVYFAGLYSKEYPKCLIVPEMNSMGLGLVNKIRDLGWERIYRRKTMDRKSKKIVEKLGFRTSAGSKQELITHFKDLLRFDLPKVYDRETLAEFRSFIRSDEAKDKGAGARVGYHDDRLISCLLAFWAEGKVQPGDIKSFTQSNKFSNIKIQPTLELTKDGKFRPPSFFREVREGNFAKWTTL